LAIVLAGYVPIHGPLPVALVISFTGWAWGARVLRAQTLSMRRREFVEAARTTGERWHRIIFWEILPNEIAIVASSLVFTIIFAILTEIGLEFLGLRQHALLVRQQQRAAARCVVVVPAPRPLHRSARRRPGVHQLRHRRSHEPSPADGPKQVTRRERNEVQ
jgi:hypothetical protein